MQHAQLAAGDIGIDHLRKVAPDTETIYQPYVVNENRRLIGVATSIADAVGVALYFVLATALLDMPALPG